MIEGTIEKLAKDIGFDIATGTDTAQGKLIAGLAQGFASYSRVHSQAFPACMQYMYLCKAWRDTKPSQEERNVIRELCEHLLREIQDQEEKK